MNVIAGCAPAGRGTPAAASAGLAFHVQRGTPTVHGQRHTGAARSRPATARGRRTPPSRPRVWAQSRVCSGLGAKAVNAVCRRSKRIRDRLERENIHGDLGPAARAMGRERRPLLAAGAGLSRFGRAKGATPEVVSQMPPESGEKAVAAIAKLARRSRSTSTPRTRRCPWEASAASRASYVGASARLAWLARADQDGGGHHDRGPEDRRVAVQNPQGGGQGRVREVGGRVRARFVRSSGSRPPGVRGNVSEVLPPQGKAVLDIGAGTGVLANMICQRGIKAQHFDAMDLTPGMLKHLVKKGIYENVHAQRRPSRGCSVKHVRRLDVQRRAHHWDDPHCLDEFVRVMKPGGICVIMFRH